MAVATVIAILIAIASKGARPRSGDRELPDRVGRTL